MKIISFELENVKKVSLVRINPSEDGLTVIGGKNKAGKTSILDGIIYALGGEKYRPSNLQRTDGMAPARIRIELSGGLVVERRGKNASLHVTDSTGKRHGQKILDDFVEELALNLPKFIAMRPEEKAKVLLQTLGIADQLEAIAIREKAAYDKRHDFGVIVDQKRKFAAEMTEYNDVPETPISVAELIARSQEILGRNAVREKARQDLAKALSRLEDARATVERLEAALKEAQQTFASHQKAYEDALSVPIDPDESTAELQEQIRNAEEINAKIRANLDKASAIAEAEGLEVELAKLTEELNAIRQSRIALLDHAEMPLPELTVERDCANRPVLRYKGQEWDCMSTMEQYRVATAIVRKLKGDCGFVLLDGLEVFDTEQLKAFDEWLVSEGLQAICTRVGTDGATVILEDGYAVQDDPDPGPTEQKEEEW